MSTTKQLAATLAAFGWPPIMRTEIACRYTCRSRWTLMRAVACGELQPAGKQKRTYMFRREDLDRWLLGPAEDEAPRIKPSVQRAPSNGNALARIEAIRRGATE